MSCTHRRGVVHQLAVDFHLSGLLGDWSTVARGSPRLGVCLHIFACGRTRVSRVLGGSAEDRSVVTVLTGRASGATSEAARLRARLVDRPGVVVSGGWPHPKGGRTLTCIRRGEAGRRCGQRGVWV